MICSQCKHPDSLVVAAINVANVAYVVCVTCANFIENWLESKEDTE